MKTINKQQQYDENKKDNKILEKLAYEYNLLKILEEAISRDGIPLLILSKYLPIIQNNINNIISSFIQREIKLSIEKDNIKFESYPKNLKKSVFIHGGMENFIMDLAFKITLSKLALMPKSDILFLDEGISAFDKDHLENIDELFIFLKSHFNKIILITHIDSIKDNIKEKIEIIKDNNFSKIKCYY